MKRTFVLLCLLATLPGHAADPNPVIAAMERSVLPQVVIANEERAPVPLRQRMTELKVPAVSIALVRNGRIEWARAYGYADREWKVPATTDTLFQAASISKSLSAVATLRLVAAGRIGLDGNVNDSLKSWHLPDNEFTTQEKVTIRRILNHTAGLTVWGFPGYVRSAPLPSAVDVLDGKGNSPAVRVFREPGKDWLYSGGGYTLLQVLLGDASGRPFPLLLRDSVLRPLGMNDSTFEQPLPAPLRDRAASAYDEHGMKVPGDWHVYPEMAAAGLWTTPKDLAKFVIAVQQMQAGRNGLLPAGLVRDMLRPGLQHDGLGLNISDDGRRFYHGGANAGFRDTMVGLLDGRGGFVIMSNGDNGGVLCAELGVTLGRLMKWPGLGPLERTVASVPDGTLDAIAGRYRFVQKDGSNVTLEIAREGKALAVTIDGQRNMTLLPESAVHFFDRDNGQRMDFIVEPTSARMVFADGQTGTRQ